MRVVEIQFVTNVMVGPVGTLPSTDRVFRAPEHRMEYLPDEQVLVIDGWRYSTVGARWMCETYALPTDDPTMFTPAQVKRLAAGEYVFRPGDTDERALPLPDPYTLHTHADLLKEPDGTDQPSPAGRPARGAKRQRKG